MISQWRADHSITEFVLHNYLWELGTVCFLALETQKNSITLPSMKQPGLHLSFLKILNNLNTLREIFVACFPGLLCIRWVLLANETALLPLPRHNAGSDYSALS